MRLKYTICFLVCAAWLSADTIKVNPVTGQLDLVGSVGAGSGDALVSDPLSQFAATTSAELASTISNETGTSLLVFNTSPTLVTPDIGAATGTSLDLTGALTTGSGAGVSGKWTANGATSGSAAITVAAIGGSPADLVLPTSTGASGQILSTNGGTPQQLSWVANGAQTPWSSNISAAGFSLTGLGVGTAAAPSLKFTNDVGLYQANTTQLGVSIGTGLQIILTTAQIWVKHDSGEYVLGSSADLRFGRRAAASLRLGYIDAASPVAQTLGVQDVATGTSNTAGANWTFTGSVGTGTGAGGSLIYQVAPAGSTGTSKNALATALTIDSTLLANFAGTVKAVGYQSSDGSAGVTGATCTAWKNGLCTTP